MKYIISLILSFNLKASVPYFLIHSLNQQSSIEVMNILDQRYGVDLEFIRIETGPCKKSKNYLAIHFCINKKGELKALSLNKKILKKSKEVFKRLR